MIENTLVTSLLSGLLLGAGAGITPGPLNALIILESLKNGRSAGIKIALAPLITDIPIIILSLLLVVELSKVSFMLALVTISGGLYICTLGVKDLFFKEIPLLVHDKKNNALRKGIIANLLTPHPYVFWITIGAPTVIESSQYSIFAAASFIFFFYLLLVGFKISLALFTGKMKYFIQRSNYLLIINILGTILIVFGLYLIYDGILELI